MRTAVYRFFDDAGHLLYIGISFRPMRRIEEHKASAAWFWRISRIEVEWLDTRSEALRIECEAIKTERPLFNISPGVRSGSSMVEEYLLSDHVKSFQKQLFIELRARLASFDIGRATRMFVRHFNGLRMAYPSTYRDIVGGRPSPTILATMADLFARELRRPPPLNPKWWSA